MSARDRLPYGDQGDGTYRNPILYADYSDPDPIAVGDDYYLTASSFACSPGLPILHSRDLVNWDLIGHALDRFPHPDYDRPQHGKGVWAPALRHHDGRFWIFFGAPDEGIYQTQAERPEGPWSPPHLLCAGKGMIDPCPFWDADGQAWLVRAQAASRCDGVNSLLTLHRMASDGSRLLDKGKVIVDGRFRHPIVEGPKLYHRGGWYYIFAPAGGVRGGWQTVFRSRSIKGPYEDRVVLVQGNTPINGPHQGGWVETPLGEDWFLHFQDRGPAGRVLHLQPMRWEDNWPLIGEAKTARDVHEPVIQHVKPQMRGVVATCRPPASDDFSGRRLGLQWHWMANAQREWYALEGDGLRLYAQGTPSGRANWYEAGNLLVQRPLDRAFCATVRISLREARPGDRAGLLLTGGASGLVALEAEEEGFQLIAARLHLAQASEPERVAEEPWKGADAWLRLSLERGYCRFFASPDGRHFNEVGEALFPTEAAWMGARIGLVALNLGTEASGGAARFEQFSYEPLARD